MMRKNVIKKVGLLILVCVSIPFVFAQETPEGKPFSFVQLCDPQLGMGGFEHDVDSFTSAVEKINALKPDFVVICGDLVNGVNKKSIDAFIDIKSKLTMPCYCAPGNHDVGNKTSKKKLDFFNKTIGEDRFVFDHKGVTFIVVNTQLWSSPVEGLSKKHDLWFKKTLKKAYKNNKPVVVIGHSPLYLGQPDEPDEYFNFPAEIRKELLDLFERYGVVAMLTGHAHKLVINDYEGIQLVSGESTSKLFDERPLGFRLWQVGQAGRLTHEFVAITTPSTKDSTSAQ